MKLAWIPMLDDQTGGYGKVGARLAGALVEAGAEIGVYRDLDWDLRVAIGGPRGWLVDRQRPVTADLVWHTMFEARPLPPDWVPTLNRCAALWVPAAWNAKVLRESGVTRPIFVSGYGVDPAEFPPLAHPVEDDTAPYTFLWAGTSFGDGQHIGDRKGGDLVLKAFRALNLPNSRLILKVGGGSLVRRINGDDRVQLIAQSTGVREYAALLALADCFVYPSHGEGFGLQPLEALALGLPVIAPAYSGLSEFIREDVALVLPTHGEETATLYRRIYEHECTWATLSVDDIADRMRWCYEHRTAAAAIGRRAAEYVARDWTWQQAGVRALDALQAIAAGDGRYLAGGST